MQFATLADLESRYPAELITLAADEATMVRDDVRIERAIEDATAEIRTILKGRYSSAELERLDAESLASLRIYAMQIALYFVSLAFSRQTDAIAERYKTAIRRLEAIATGKAALSFAGADNGAAPGEAPTSAASPNEVIMDAPERMFTRSRAWGF